MHHMRHIPISPCTTNGERNEEGVVFFHRLLLERAPVSDPRDERFTFFL